MTRPLLLSNGSLQVGINLYGMVHDLYFPYVGLENHCAAQHMRHRIGVWVQGQFSWLDDGNWDFSMRYDPAGLIGHTRARHHRLQITLEFTDCVDSEADIFMRSIHIINGSDNPREIRLFLHQMLLISNSLNRDTAQYLPDHSAILHYKGHRAFVIGAKDSRGTAFSQFSIGLFGMEGHEGVFRDAEDGVLSGNIVEFGQVDSAVGFNFDLAGLESTHAQYWLTAARTQQQAIALHDAMLNGDVHQRFEHTAESWKRWLQPAQKHMAGVPQKWEWQLRNSLLIVKSQTDRHGGVIASTDTTMLNYWRDAYAYCWPRDGAYALWPLMRMGYKTELKNFFAFSRRGLHPDGFLLQKYQPDGAIGTTWHPYLAQGRIIPPMQEDETAIVIALFCEYMKLYRDKRVFDEFYDSLVVPACNFMAHYIDPQTKLPRASYDLWEEKFLTTTYTTAVVYSALWHAGDLASRHRRHADAVRWQTAAQEMLDSARQLLYNAERNYFYKGFINKGGGQLEYDATIDASSLYGASMFGLFAIDSPEAAASRKTYESTYNIQAGGPTIGGRYENDRYNTTNPSGNGNPWYITTLWMAQFDIQMGNIKRAETTLNWVQAHMLSTGVLPEQFDPETYKFISVAPLTWSQAEFLNTALDFKKRTRGE